MKNRFLKFISVLSISLMLSILLSSFSVSAAGYSSYQERSDQVENFMVKQKAVYTSKLSISGAKLGISDFSAPSDICVTKDSIYLLDSANSRIVVMNKDYTLNRIISSIVLDGQEISISTASGIFVHDDGKIYIADTENERVLVVNPDGNVRHSITKPSSPIVPKSLEFKAKKVIVDIDGYIFVLCEGVYYGAMTFDKDYNFCGFFGANQTSTNLLDTIKYFFTKTLQTDTQKEYSIRTLPYEFDDFYEYNGFIYTATKNTDNNQGQIRKLSNSGINVLTHGGSSADSFAFGNGKTVTLIDKTVATENFSSVAVDDEGYIYALDSTYGRVFVYDEDCNLITAFGGGMGLGNQKGSFTSACELALNGKDVIVVDNVTNIVTVFKRTDYGSLLYSAINHESNGEYDKAFSLWEDILSQDAFCQRSYVGLANYYISCGEYETALEYAEKGLNKDLYEQAFEEVRRTFLADNFIWIFVIAFVALGIAIFLVIKRKKSGPKQPKEPSILKRTLLSVRYPIQTANYIKRIRSDNQKRLLNTYTIIAIGIFFIMFIFKVLETTAGGFLYVSFDSNTYNSAFVLFSTVGLALLWCIVNWGLCTLFEGKGTFKEITIVTAFALIPQIIYSIFFIIASHFLVYSESAIISGALAIAWIATVIILLVSLSVIHDYSFFRALGMGLVTIIGIILVIFMMLLVITLIQDVLEFARSVYNEIVYR